MTWVRGRLPGVLTTIALGVAAGWELAIRESVHRVGSEWRHIAVLCLATMALVIYQLCWQRRTNTLLALGLERWPLPVMAALYVALVFGSTTGSTYRLWALEVSRASVPWLALSVGLALSALLNAARWRGLQRACASAAILFVGIQPIWVALGAPSVDWLTRATGGVEGAPGDLTVYVLLDEWNASAVAPIEAALRRTGLTTASKAVRPVGKGTSQVIPALFTGNDFSDGKPCSWTSVCSNKHILDFSRIRAARPDVDIVGFYQPYCSIQNLRWCYRGKVRSDVANIDRWRCILRRSTGWPLEATAALCDGIFRAPWNEMLEDVLSAVWTAPGWKEGGAMFLHLPLPHPPGRLSRASLEVNYRDSLQRTAEVVEQMANLAKLRPARATTFVIFSDHPLRQSLWCKEQWVFADLGCKPVAALHDENVPLLVASNRALPNIAEVNSNVSAFQVRAP